MCRFIEQFFRRTDLNDFTFIHHHNLVSESQRLGLVMGHINHGVAQLAVKVLQLGAQLPLHMRVDDRQRLIKQDRIDVVAHKTAAQRYLLFFVGGQPARLPVSLVGKIENLDHLADAFGDFIRGHPAVDQRKSQILAHGHRVVDDRKLENLSDIALFGLQMGYILAVEPDMALGRNQQTGNDVQQGGLAAAGWPQAAHRRRRLPTHSRFP